MKRRHFIALDVHCAFSEVAVVRETGEIVLKDRCPTTIPTLLAVLARVPRM